VYVLKPNKRTTVTTLLAKGTSQREIARLTGVDRKTIRSIARERAGPAPNSPTPATGTTADSPGVATGPVGEIPPPRPPATIGPQSLCEPHRTFIEEQLRLRRNYTAIYQDLVDRFGFTGHYNSVKRFSGRIVRREPEQYDRLEFAPGEEAQVDYGEGALTRVLGSDRYRRPRLFVMTLRYSRRSFRRVIWDSSKEIWARLHEEAFRYFGGSTAYVVLDNLKEGVLKPDLYEPELNPVYGAMLAHYGVVADPARVRDPNRKGTVEHAIGHTQGTALKGRRFENIEDQNTYLEQWETRWAAPRIHGSAKRQVEAMFQEERAHLQPLPLQGFAYFTECERTVGDDTCIRLAPPHSRHGRESGAPGPGRKRVERRFGQVGVGGLVDGFQSRRQPLAILPGRQGCRIADQVHDAGLDLRLGINRFDRLWEAAQVVDDGDQDIVQPAVFQFIENLQPEFGALGLLDPQAQHFLAPVGANAQGQINGLVLDCAFVTDFQTQCVEIHDRVHRFERPLLPLRDFFQHLVGNGRDQIRRHFGTVQFQQMSLDFSHTHPARTC
jgi:transposase